MLRPVAILEGWRHGLSIEHGAPKRSIMARSGPCTPGGGGGTSQTFRYGRVRVVRVTAARNPSRSHSAGRERVRSSPRCRGFQAGPAVGAYWMTATGWSANGTSAEKESGASSENQSITKVPTGPCLTARVIANAERQIEADREQYRSGDEEHAAQPESGGNESAGERAECEAQAVSQMHQAVGDPL